MPNRTVMVWNMGPKMGNAASPKSVTLEIGECRERYVLPICKKAENPLEMGGCRKLIEKQLSQS